MNIDLRQELARFGADARNIKLFESPSAELLRYIDLLPEVAGRGRMRAGLLPVGVVEHSERPLLYVVRADALTNAPGGNDAEAVKGVLRRLACRGEGDFVAFIKPGVLTVYQIALTKRKPQGFYVNATDARAPLLMQELAGGMGEDRLIASTEESARQRSARAEALHQLLFRLLTGVSKALRDSRALSTSRRHDQVLPLVGRALFARFLVDRGIINADTLPALFRGKVTPEQCFSTPELAAMTCTWLDDKFNGELLPLFESPECGHKEYVAFFRAVHCKNNRMLQTLANVMYRAPDGILSLDLDWTGIDFAHVPIGLLSEVYEDYAHRFYKDDALRESVRFTPRHIAEFTVSQAFDGIPTERRHQARLLDPAAGAGVFLVLALQRLVRERWQATGERPDTHEIRTILYEQVRGFDINASALTLAALSLYLTALELDPDPYPPEKLRFERLLDKVLFNLRAPHERYPYNHLVLGSLGSLGASEAHIGQYDIVIGNPPWTAWDGEDGAAFNAQMTTMVRGLLLERSRGNEELAKIAGVYEHNDMLPDVAFLWRAQQWAKPNGVIALIVHGRIMFKRAERGADVRTALFRSMRVTGVLNGAELMKLWPTLNQPFCIVFARNEVPKQLDCFRFVTPELDTAPGARFRMRFDHESSHPIELAKLFGTPYLLKSLFRGTRLDVELIDRLYSLFPPETAHAATDADQVSAPARIATKAQRIGDLWGENHRLPSGQGFIPGKNGSTEQLLALNGKQFTSDDKQGLFIDISALDAFAQRRLLRPRRAEIYKPPLVLICESPGEDRFEIRARLHLGRTPLIYNRSYYGFSTHGHLNAKMLARYLFVLASSNLFVYFILQVSAKFGVERRTVYMEDIEDFPVISLETLTAKQLDSLERIVNELTLNDEGSWLALNRWVSEVYQLSSADEQLIQDTLATRMPYAKAISRALNPATDDEVEHFRNVLEMRLKPFFEPNGEPLEVRLVALPVLSWVIFDIVSAVEEPSQSDIVSSLAMKLATEEGASRILMQIGKSGCLRIAIRKQYRYLTASRARLCALDILRSYGSVFPLKTQ